VGRHSKNWNTTPYDQQAPAAQKAAEFEAQYEQNRDPNPPTHPNLDSYENGKKQS